MSHITYNFFSEIGPRDKNEDSIAFDEDKSIYVVCDGMGGHESGEISSRTVADTIVTEWPGDVNAICRKASEALNTVSGNTEMGTTMALVAIEGDNAIFAYCGDTRIYLVRNRRIVYQSVDHVALTDIGNPIITRGFFTHSNRYAPEIHKEAIIYGDRILICTDGVYGNGKWSDLRDLLTSDICTSENIRNLASKNAHDNYSAILLEIES